MIFTNPGRILLLGICFWREGLGVALDWNGGGRKGNEVFEGIAVRKVYFESLPILIERFLLEHLLM
jgi:hypothetical protein